MTDEQRHDETANERRMQHERRHDGSGTMTVEPEKERRTQQHERRHGGASTGTQNPSAPPATQPTESQRTSRQMDYWPEMTQYRQKFDEIQAQFIEEPREAVKNAEQLVEQALEKMTSTMRDRIHGMHRDAENADTEKLRLAMKSLRDFMDSLGGRRAG